jgi:hypothetical protein
MRAYLLNIIFFVLIGYVEAIIWSYINDDEMNAGAKKQFHKPLVLLRICFYIPLLWHIGWIKVAYLFMCYPFWHLGSMYWWRNKLNPKIYKARFFADSSTTSSAGMDNLKTVKWLKKLLKLPFWLRALAFVIGSIFYFFSKHSI